MTDTFANLGQVMPTAGASTSLYQPAASAVISSIVVCNTGAVASKFRLSYAPTAKAESTEQYLYYDTVIPANQSFVITIGITMPKGDLLRCYSDTGYVTFNVFGDELS